MDENLNRRWIEALPPFDGYTLYLSDESPGSIVGKTVVRFLFTTIDSRLGIDDTLYINEDWHAHDGFIKASRGVSKTEFLAELANDPDKWFSIVDDQVYWGIYDLSDRFYLTFGKEDELESVLTIRLTIDETTIRELSAELNAKFQIGIELAPAKKHYDQIYGG